MIGGPVMLTPNDLLQIDEECRIFSTLCYLLSLKGDCFDFFIFFYLHYFYLFYFLLIFFILYFNIFLFYFIFHILYFIFYIYYYNNKLLKR
jgi:hypothetical protein